MAAGKTKLVVTAAVFILAGVLLLALIRISAASQPGADSVIPPSQEQAQKNHLETQSAAASPDTQTGGYNGRELFYKMLLSVLVVIGLGIAAIYVSKKLLPRITNLPGKQIRVVETAYIAPHRGIHLIQIGARRLLIASTNENVTMLADVTDAAGNFAAELEKRS